MGDPAGVGPEIIIKALSLLEIQRLCRPVVIGDASVLNNAMKVAKSSPLIINVIKRCYQYPGYGQYPCFKAEDR